METDKHEELIMRAHQINYDNLCPEDYDHEEWMQVEDHEKEIEDLKDIVTRAYLTIRNELYATDKEINLIKLHDAIGDLLEATDLKNKDYPDHVPVIERMTAADQMYRVHGLNSNLSTQP